MRMSVAKNALLPDDDAARAFMFDATIGTKVELRVAPENFLTMIHATLSSIERRGWYGGKANLRAYLALVLGFFDEVDPEEQGGRQILVPRSLSEMKVHELEVFWEDAVAFIRERLLPPPGQDAAADAIRRGL